MKKRIAFLMLAVVVLAVAWKGLIVLSLRWINSDNDEVRDAGAFILGVAGGRDVIEPMVTCLRNESEEHGLVKGLLRINRRIPLDREPYLSMIAGYALNKKTDHFNRALLAEVVEGISGEKFGYVYQYRGITDEAKLPSDVRRRNVEALKKIRAWWVEKK